ncbi:DNA cytosine methyltransferase [Bacillus sp. CDB3]|uniref:DNA cytosine methyltransferase n=1 Tax=Bacillus sp. CDB3 TaxID=360310 RepID=UPI0009D8C499|nr:DNA (cytosine-5-)-methyltransferase [Bacillus sp. CDB3]OQR57430.1 hypothetical protein CDB3_07375 [Bacillus sp. CDB3]
MGNLIDFFSGAGGFSNGFIEAGFIPVKAYDNNKHAVDSYKHNIGDHVEQRDVLTIEAEELPSAPVWTFGFPCQDLSNCGRKQEGLINGKRSSMFFEIMRLLREIDADKKPLFILAENVNDLKPYLGIVEEEYERAGYKMFYTLYNSAFWGVPQNRERYFVVGVRSDFNIDFQFPEQPNLRTVKIGDILEDNVEDHYFFTEEKRLRILEQVKLGKVSQSKGIICINPRKVDGSQTYQQDRVYRTDGIMAALTAQLSGRLNIVVDEEKAIYRKLSAREWARMQAFPDSYDMVVSEAQFIKQMGNAVTVLPVVAIAKEMMKALKRFQEETEEKRIII